MKLIDKAAVVAEIYRLRDFANDRWDVEEVNGVDKFLDKLIPYINILEVKEVDLEKEIDTYFDNYEIASKEECYLTHEQACVFAKHFFELGIQQSNYNKNEEKS